MRDRTKRVAVLALTLSLFAPLTFAADAAAQSPHGAANPHGEEPEADEPEADPHGHAHGKGDDAMFQAPQDGATDDPTIPVGTLEIHIVDPSGKPLPGIPVTLGVLFNSVAKGESRKRLSATANDKGIARFEHLDTGSSVAYRPSVNTEGATFAVMPFRLPEKTGMRGLLHVYPVVDNVESALIVTQSIIYAEIKDDRVQIQQAVNVFNLGKTAWVPKDLVVPLPEDFTAFTTQQGMTDVGVESVPKKGVRIHGTFVPGQHMLEFRWQLPYSGQAEVRFDVGMAPHMAAARVIAPSSKDMKLDVAGFPPPQSTNDAMGQRSLVTERQLRKDEPALKTVSVAITGLPTEGPAKFLATLLAGVGLAVGVVVGARKPSARDHRKERDRRLADIEELERAYKAGDVGPKTYENERRELVDAIARTFAEPVVKPRRKPRAETSA